MMDSVGAGAGRRPLTGLRIAVTRPAARAGPLASLLQKLGAEPLLTPLIATAPPTDPSALRAAIEGIAGYDWIVFPSAASVAALAGAAQRAGSRTGVACVGAATAAAAAAAGFRVDVVPAEHTAEALASAVAERLPPGGGRVLLPQARDGRPELAARLRAQGADVSVVEGYRTVADAEGARQLAACLDAGVVDVVTFTAPSAVRCFAAHVGGERLSGVKVAVIGTITAAAARSAGLPVDVVADPFTAEGLADALAASLGRADMDDAG
jgi:uroporphyrinogen-III synthase